MKHDFFPPEALQETLAQVSQAISDHNKWHSAFIRSIICNLPENELSVLPASHASCNFGTWFYSEHNPIPKTHPKHTSIDLKHKAMHEMAASLLLEFQEKGSVTVLSYDKFSYALELFQAELTEFEREIENSLYQHDSLTGANTRHGLLSALKEHQALIKRDSQSHCCIVMMDLDNFKEVNDTHGHASGDKVLATVIHYIADQLRPYDSIYRYGGEEFVILMQQTDLNTGYNIVERLRKEVALLPIQIDTSNLIHITASFGIVNLNTEAEVEMLIKHADKAMYEAKAAGRNCVKVKKA